MAYHVLVEELNYTRNESVFKLLPISVMRVVGNSKIALANIGAKTPDVLSLKRNICSVATMGLVYR